MRSGGGAWGARSAPTNLLLEWRAGGYINDDRDTGNVRLDIDLNTDCFSHGQLYVACSRVGKPDNLFVCTYNGTAKNVVYSQDICI